MRAFTAAGWIKAPSIDKVTDAQSQQCIEGMCKKDVNDKQLFPVDQAVKSVIMNMNKEDTMDRVCSPRRDYANTLRASGYVNVVGKKPHIDMNQILRKPKPVQLYQRMQEAIIRRKNENFYKETFNCFLREVAVQADKLQTEHSVPSATNRRSFKEAKHHAKVAMQVVRRNEARQEATPVKARQRQTHNHKQDVNKERKRDVYETPLCLNPECKAKGRRSHISKYGISNNETKTMILEQYSQAKRALIDGTRKSSGSVFRITDTPSSPHLSISGISFARSSIEINVMADQEANATIIHAKLLD